MYAIIEVENEKELKNLKNIKIIETLDIELINKNDEDYKYYLEYEKNKNKDTFYSFEEVKKMFE